MDVRRQQSQPGAKTETRQAKANGIARAQYPPLIPFSEMGERGDAHAELTVGVEAAEHLEGPGTHDDARVDQGAEAVPLELIREDEGLAVGRDAIWRSSGAVADKRGETGSTE